LTILDFAHPFFISLHRSMQHHNHSPVYGVSIHAPCRLSAICHWQRKNNQAFNYRRNNSHHGNGYTERRGL